jgi:hypothetical protein
VNTRRFKLLYPAAPDYYTRAEYHLIIATAIVAE